MAASHPRRRTSIAILLLVCATLVLSPAPTRADDLYEPWAQVLETYVDEEGLVDYAGLSTRGREQLQAFMQALATIDPAALPSDAHRIAFWINAYNAVILWQAVERYPLDSVKDVGALFGLVGGFFKKRYPIAGRDLHADDIEHATLRRDYPDSRIHWALVCAAFGCPRLIRRPYLASDLDEVLTARAHEFLGNARALQLDEATGTLYLSRYFDWYADDFEAESGDLIGYVLRYVPAEMAAAIRQQRDRLRVRFIDYDWTLNDQAKGPRGSRPIKK